MIDTPIKKPDSAKSGSFDSNNKDDLIIRKERLTRNSILFHKLGWIPRDWVSQIAVIVAGAK